jgi:hypothetical protein
MSASPAGDEAFWDSPTIGPSLSDLEVDGLDAKTMALFMKRMDLLIRAAS